MAREEQTGKTEAELRKRAWDLAEDIEFCVLVTWNGQKQHSRPMHARIERDANVIYFLTDRNGVKDDEIKQFPNVSVTFANPSSFKFVALSGKASVSDDRAKIKKLWDASDKAWWDSANDPDIRLLTFHPDEAELWDSPNFLVSTVMMLSAAVTGAKPKIGDNAKIAM
jgi:general stress protein 26